MTEMIVLVLFGAVLCGGWYTVYRIRRKVRSISRMAFGTDSFLDGISRQEELLAETPKSVSGMTRLLLPQIRKDFPEFHWQEWRQRAQQLLIAYFEAIEKQDMSGLTSCSDALRGDVSAYIEDLRQRNVRESYDAVRFHQTEIYEYRKQSGGCTIRLQTALEYRFSTTQEPAVTDKKEQHRFFLDLMYVQDAESLDASVRGVAVNCPNCGSPLPGLGARSCEYCGSSIEPLNLRVWRLQRIEKRD